MCGSWHFNTQLLGFIPFFNLKNFESFVAPLTSEEKSLAKGKEEKDNKSIFLTSQLAPV